MATVVDNSISGARSALELDGAVERRSCHSMTVASDKGSELTSSTMLKWQQDRRVEWRYIASNNSVQTGFVESFNGCLRDECLNEQLFCSYRHVLDLIHN